MLAIVTRHDAGITLDEPSLMRYARHIASWFMSGFVDLRAATKDRDLAIYGGLFDTIAQFAIHFTPLDPVGTRHAASALCALFGVVAVWCCARKLAGPRAGLLAALLLATTPTWLGHGLFNPKDIPFATAAAWATFGMLRFAVGTSWASWTTSIGSGIAIGAALGVRPGGMFLLSYPLVGLGLRAAAHFLGAKEALSLRGAWPACRTAALRVLGCWAAAWACMLSAWPWALQAPLTRPFIAAWRAAHSPWAGDMRFLGGVVNAQHLPPSYLPVWFAVTLPESYYVAGACGAVLVWRAVRQRSARLPSGELSPAWTGLACLGFAGLAPLLGAVLTHPVIYDAHRHFLFLLPPFAALAGIALERFLTEAAFGVRLRAAVLGTLLAVLSLVVVDSLRLHPYEYVYFNHLAGGLPGAHQRFETDYWGESYSEGLDWLSTQLAANDSDGTPVHVALCQNYSGVETILGARPELAKRLLLERHFEEADIVLADPRYNCHKRPGKVLHIVQRMGVPLLYVIEQRAVLSHTDPNEPRHAG